MKSLGMLVVVLIAMSLLPDSALVAQESEAPPAETEEAATPEDVEPAVTTTPSAVTRRATADGVIDELDLSSTRVTGNQELPKVLYIVPWKQADLGDLVGRPVNTLLDEVLEPVDRDVFRRQNRYYQSLYGVADESEE